MQFVENKNTFQATWIESMQNVNSPEPTWRNTPVLFNIIWESRFPIPLSHFGQVLSLLPWFDISDGTLHLVLDPLVHPKPSFARCEGHIVIECMLTGGENMAARLRIKSTSSFGPEKPKLIEWLSIRFEQASRGMITVSCFLDRLSKPQFPPTILLNEHLTSIIKKTTWNAILTLFISCLVLKCQLKRISIIERNWQYWWASIKRRTRTIPKNSGTSVNQLLNYCFF